MGIKGMDFPLEEVLLYYESRLEQLQLALSERQRELKAEEEILQRLHGEAEAIARRAGRLRGPVSLERLTGTREYLQVLTRRIRAQGVRVGRARLAVEEARQAVLTAHQETETLRKLQEKAERAFKERLERVEGQMIDEAAVAAFVRGMAG